jgi:hypothetical protein
MLDGISSYYTQPKAMKWSHKISNEMFTGTFPAAGAKWIWIFSYYESERYFNRNTYSINRPRCSLLKWKTICNLLINYVARNLYFNQSVMLRISIVINFSQRFSKAASRFGMDNITILSFLFFVNFM